jgi:hypothetical protein
VAKVDSFKKQVDFCLAVEEGKSASPRPQQFRQQAKHPQSSHRDSKRPPSTRSGSSRRQDSHPGKSQNPRRSDERPQNSNKPATFQTSGSKFSTTQRPLIKSSGSIRFQKRRR